MTKISQEDAARLVYAHEKALQAHEDRTASPTMWRRWKATEKAFADLIATLVEEE